jgi:hypothetical protein
MSGQQDQSNASPPQPIIWTDANFRMGRGAPGVPKGTESESTRQKKKNSLKKYYRTSPEEHNKAKINKAAEKLVVREFKIQRTERELAYAKEMKKLDYTVDKMD